MAHRGNFPFGPVGVPGVFGLRREIDRLFEDAFGGNQQQGGSGARQGGQNFTPAVDAREEEREIVLHMDLPGVRPEDVELSVENGLLTVRGQRHQQRKEGQEGRYQFVERSYGSFTRQFHLPQGVDEAQISADFDHGELTIRIPKPQQPQPRRIQIGQSARAGQGGQGGRQVSDTAGAASAPGAGGSPAAGAGMMGGSMDTGAAGGMLGGAMAGGSGAGAGAGASTGGAADGITSSSGGAMGGSRS